MLVGDSLILTNEHVIDDMTDGIVILNNGAEYEIEGVVVKDAQKDLALIKTTRKINFDPVKLGSIETTNKGDKVVAIGSPHGFQNTVSEGLISAFRNMDGVQMIQINAPMDQGSSGGGLFNSKGELIGINTIRYESNAQLNFAVAIDELGDWDRYLHMDFHNIDVIAPVTPPDIPKAGTLPVPGLEDIALGMTKEQVKYIETAPLLNEESDQLMYLNKSVLGLSAKVAYTFNNGRLEQISIFHDIVDNQYDLDLLEGYFYIMLEDFSSIYGQPVSVDTNWFDDDDGYSLAALWFTKDNDVFLTARVRADYSSYGGILISIR